MSALAERAQADLVRGLLLPDGPERTRVLVGSCRAWGASWRARWAERVLLARTARLGGLAGPGAVAAWLAEAAEARRFLALALESARVLEAGGSARACGNPAPMLTLVHGGS